jgi:hypothetical protein
MEIINTIIDQGVNGVPEIVYPETGVATNRVRAKDIILSNKEFIKSEITSWIAETYIVKQIPNYNAFKCARDVGYVIDALIYDLMYDGNSQIKDVAESYYLGTTSYIPGEGTYTAAAFGRLKTVYKK